MVDLRLSIVFIIALMFYSCTPLEKKRELSKGLKVMNTDRELVALEEIAKSSDARIFLFIPPIYCRECFDFSLIELGKGKNIEMKKEIVVLGCFSSERDFLLFKQIGNLSNSVYYIQDCDNFSFFSAITLFEVDADMNIVRDAYLDYLDPDCVNKFLLNN